MTKAFVDDDLIDRVPDGAAGASRDLAPGAAEGHSVYSQKKRELPEQVNQAVDEIERLRQRQEHLERRKQELVDQRRRIESFEHNRRDMLDKLGRSAVLVVREGEQASRMAALCTEVGSLFSRLHQEMESFFPERWTEEEYDARLTQALAQVEAAGSEYRRAMDRINALAWNRGDGQGAADAAALGGPAVRERQGLPATFTGWLLAGLAFTLPLLLVASALVALIVLLKGAA
jgi:prefoldin subunit 5